MESTAEISLLSTYSISGLLKESQEDIVSSIETDIPSDLPGDTSMLLETGTATVATVGTITGGAATSFLLSGNEVVIALGKTTAEDLTLDKVDTLFPKIDDVDVHDGVSFFVFATLVTCVK